MCGTFLKNLLPAANFHYLLPTPKEAYDLNLNEIT